MGFILAQINNGLLAENYLWLFITFNMVGKLFNAAAYAAIYMFSAELFPTVIRNSCMGISSVCARVGGIMGDYVILLVSLQKGDKLHKDVITMFPRVRQIDFLSFCSTQFGHLYPI